MKILGVWQKCYQMYERNSNRRNKTSIVYFWLQLCKPHRFIYRTAVSCKKVIFLIKLF